MRQHLGYQNIIFANTLTFWGICRRFDIREHTTQNITELLGHHLASPIYGAIWESTPQTISIRDLDQELQRSFPDYSLNQDVIMKLFKPHLVSWRSIAEAYIDSILTITKLVVRSALAYTSRTYQSDEADNSIWSNHVQGFFEIQQIKLKEQLNQILGSYDDRYSISFMAKLQKQVEARSAKRFSERYAQILTILQQDSNLTHPLIDQIQAAYIQAQAEIQADFEPARMIADAVDIHTEVSAASFPILLLQ